MRIPSPALALACPTALLSIPLRYMHTPAEVVDLADVEAVGRLMAAYIRKEGAVQ